MRAAPGWSDTGDYVHTESLLLELTAPASYPNAPTRIEFHSFPGEVHVLYGSQATAHSIAAEHARSHFGSSAQSIASTVVDCSIAAETAAVFGYADGTERGYRVSIVHKDRLFEIWLFGTDGLSAQSIQDGLGMIASMAWIF